MDTARENPQGRPLPEPVVATEIHDIPWREARRIFGSGVCMGTADLVPGVSGGTMAVALGIYRHLLAAITSVNGHFARAVLARRFQDALSIIHWRFLLCLGAGIGVALIVMGKVIKLQELVVTQPKPVYAVFFGLVLASTVILARRIERWGPVRLVLLGVGTVLGFAIVRMVPVDTPEGSLFIFGYGALAITAMILPGISGSFILLILNKYEYIITSVLELRFEVLLPFAAGCALGLMLFSRFLGWLLARWHDNMIAALTGLLLGSLWRIWPYQHVELATVREKVKIVASEPFWPPALEASVLALMFLGLIAVFAIELLAMRRRARLSGV